MKFIIEKICLLRYSWEGQEIRDYSLDLRRVPFCVDQQVISIGIDLNFPAIAWVWLELRPTFLLSATKILDIFVSGSQGCSCSRQKCLRDENCIFTSGKDKLFEKYKTCYFFCIF